MAESTTVAPPTVDAPPGEPVRALEPSDRPLRQRPPLVGIRRLRLTRGALAFAATLAASLAVALSQPIGSAWWTYADADATYAGSGANLMAGEHTFYLDHPGMPLQDLMAITYEIRYLAHRIFVGDTSPHAYISERLLNLGDSAPYWRTFAVIFWLFGAAIAFLVGRRLFGHWGYGLAAGLLWIGAPGLATMSIQYRPDVLLSGLVLLVGYLIVRAAERRDAWLYALAALTLGLTMTVKLHAAGLLVPLALALVWRPPDAGWPRRFLEALRTHVVRHRVALMIATAVWIALAVAFNRLRLPLDTYANEHRLVAQAAIGFAAYLALSLLVHRLGFERTVGRVLSPFAALLGLVLAIGIFLPGTLFLDEGLLMLVKMKDGLTGGGINEGVDTFSLNWDWFGQWPLRQALFVVMLGAVGAVLGLVKRDPVPALWFVGAAMMGAMAAARLGTAHYFAPCYVLSIPAALWLFRRRGGVAAAAALALVVVYVLVPQAQRLTRDAEAARKGERYAAAAARIADSLLKPKEVALSESLAADIPDIRYHDLVDSITSYSPEYPYRFLPDSPVGLETARSRGLRLSYYIGWLPNTVKAPTRLTLGVGGSYDVRPRPELADPTGVAVLELLHGEGVDRPFRYPDARYDPWTGYYESEGHHYDFAGNEISDPARRKYDGKLGLWFDAYGDFWNAKGELVMSKPELRTAN